MDKMIVVGEYLSRQNDNNYFGVALLAVNDQFPEANNIMVYNDVQTRRHNCWEFSPFGYVSFINLAEYSEIFAKIEKHPHEINRHFIRLTEDSVAAAKRVNERVKLAYPNDKASIDEGFTLPQFRLYILNWLEQVITWAVLECKNPVLALEDVQALKNKSALIVGPEIIAKGTRQARRREKKINHDFRCAQRKS